MAEFKSLSEILREPPKATPVISPLIAEVSATPPRPIVDERLSDAHLAQRLDIAVERLLREIACEVLGRELLLAPVEIAAIVERLRARYAIDRDPEVRVDARANGDIAFVSDDGEIDASLGRRLALAIDRALR